MEQMKASEALERKVEAFLCQQPCRVCGGKERRFAKWSLRALYCPNCEAIGSVSSCKVRARENQSNKAKQKLLAQPGCLPVVFGGMNTI